MLIAVNRWLCYVSYLKTGLCEGPPPDRAGALRDNSLDGATEKACVPKAAFSVRRCS
jgi:hypothetical protein